ncbi:MAG: hypothetical protein H6Q65_1070 [Firmicutes bacterium]|nr:hypothetical protein [Bacillota bacterium]
MLNCYICFSSVSAVVSAGQVLQFPAKKIDSVELRENFVCIKIYTKFHEILLLGIELIAKKETRYSAQSQTSFFFIVNLKLCGANSSANRLK